MQRQQTTQNIVGTRTYYKKTVLYGREDARCIAAVNFDMYLILQSSTMHKHRMNVDKEARQY